MSQDKYGSEAMYLPPPDEEGYDESFYNQPFVDRSALLRATLNSLAMTNVAAVLNSKKHKKKLSPFEIDDEILSLEEVFKDEEE